MTSLLFYAPVGLISIPILLYLLIFVFKRLTDAVFKEHHAPIEILDFAVIGGFLVVGNLFTSNLCAILYFTYRKLRIATENKSERTYLDIMDTQTGTAWVLKEGAEIEIPMESVEIGDIVVVRAGQVIPADGVIVYGAASVGQHMLTGEFQPAEKGIDDPVLAATIIISGIIHIRAEKSGRETEAARIAVIIKNTKEFTAYMEAIGQEMADKSVFPISVLGIGSYPLVGASGSAALFFPIFWGA